MGDFPVFARDVTPIGPMHRGPGEINYPIAAGGVVVNPGDIIVGDLNGVVVVPREFAESLLAQLRGARGRRVRLQRLGRDAATSRTPGSTRSSRTAASSINGTGH